MTIEGHELTGVEKSFKMTCAQDKSKTKEEPKTKKESVATAFLGVTIIVIILLLVLLAAAFLVKRSCSPAEASHVGFL